MLSPLQIVYVEDEPGYAQPTIAGLVWLLGIKPENLHYFDRTSQAKAYITSQDKKSPVVVILDNHTLDSGFGASGISLALDLLREKEDHPSRLVTMSSNDLYLTTKYSGRFAKELKAEGGEFWAKDYENFLMLLWVADCIKGNKYFPRENWLKKFGIEEAYPQRLGLQRKEDFPISVLCRELSDCNLTGNDKNEVLGRYGLRPGDFIKSDTREIFSKLGIPVSQTEGNPVSKERK